MRGWKHLLRQLPTTLLLLLVLACTQTVPGTKHPPATPTFNLSSPLSPLPTPTPPRRVPTPTPNIPPTRAPKPTFTPTPVPTWPVVLPPLSTPTPLPAHLVPEDVLPTGAHLLADVVAPLKESGEPVALLVYRWPVGSVENGPFPQDTDVHMQLIPLGERTYTPRLGPQSVPGVVRMRVVDLEPDGYPDILLEPAPSPTYPFSLGLPWAWPLILSHRTFPFVGGYWGDVYKDDPRWFAHMRPVLYYAGPKGVRFSDAEGDGHWEVDVIYSTEDGADTWQVDRYVWNSRLQRYEATRTWTEPAQEPVPPRRFERWVEQLRPFYAFPPSGKAPYPAKRVEMRVQNVLHVDVDGDGRREWLVDFFMHPVYGTSEDWKPNGPVGLAVFDEDDRLLWRSEQDEVTWCLDGDRIDLKTRLLWRPEGREGARVLHLITVDFSGSGAWHVSQLHIYEPIRRTLRRIQPVMLAGGGRQGAGYGSRVNHAVWPQDVDGDGVEEWMFERRVRYENLELSSPFLANYTLRWPGAIAYTWDGHVYVPGYFVDGSRRVRIRPNEHIFLVPHMPRPLRIDGRTDDWHMVEYMMNMQEAVHWARFSGPLSIHLAWDERSLYVATHIPLGGNAYIAVDTDLEGDFERNKLDDDDVVFRVETSSARGCQEPPRVYILHPTPARVVRVKAALAPLDYPDACAFEMAIPWTLLGVHGNMVAHAGYTLGEPRNLGLRTYVPAAGQIWGGGVWSRSAYAPPPDMNDLRKWHTWIFVRHD